MMPCQNPVAHSGGVASLASKARPAEHVVNLTDLSLPPIATLMPWMVCTVWPVKVRGEEVYMVVNV